MLSLLNFNGNWIYYNTETNFGGEQCNIASNFKDASYEAVNVRKIPLRLGLPGRTNGALSYQGFGDCSRQRHH